MLARCWAAGQSGGLFAAGRGGRARELQHLEVVLRGQAVVLVRIGCVSVHKRVLTKSVDQCVDQGVDQVHGLHYERCAHTAQIQAQHAPQCCHETLQVFDGC